MQNFVRATLLLGHFVTAVDLQSRLQDALVHMVDEEWWWKLCRWAQVPGLMHSQPIECEDSEWWWSLRGTLRCVMFSLDSIGIRGSVEALYVKVTWLGNTSTYQTPAARNALQTQQLQTYAARCQEPMQTANFADLLSALQTPGQFVCVNQAAFRRLN